MFGAYNETAKRIERVFDTIEECERFIRAYPHIHPYNPLLAHDPREEVLSAHKLTDIHPEWSKEFKYLPKKYAIDGLYNPDEQKLTFEYCATLREGYKVTMDDEEHTLVCFTIDAKNRATADRMVKSLLAEGNITEIIGVAID